MLTIVKVFTFYTFSLSTLPVSEIENTLVAFKTNSNWKGEEGLYLGGHIGLFYSLSIQGYGRPNFKNQYALERMIVWFINPLELNLTRFDPLEIIITVKKILVSHPEKSNCANLTPGKIYIL